jgi:hypothetical protein
MTLPKRSTPESFTLTPPPAAIPVPLPDPIPTFDAVNIRASDGSVWRIRVTPMGSMLLDRIVT